MNARTAAQSELSDEQLMQRVGHDDTSAFDLLLWRHQAAVFHFIRRTLNDAEQAEDLTQECFVRVWRARRSYLPKAMFRTWLFTIARRLALDAAKRREALTLSLADEQGSAKPSAFALARSQADPEQMVLARELACVLDTALDRMPADQREVVVLRDIEQMSYEQIANIVGCPLGTVKSRLSAGRSLLKAAARRWREDR